MVKIMFCKYTLVRNKLQSSFKIVFANGRKISFVELQFFLTLGMTFMIIYSFNQYIDC